jgi:hypothetical protein
MGKTVSCLCVDDGHNTAHSDGEIFLGKQSSSITFPQVHRYEKDLDELTVHTSATSDTLITIPVQPPDKNGKKKLDDKYAEVASGYSESEKISPTLMERRTMLEEVQDKTHQPNVFTGEIDSTLDNLSEHEPIVKKTNGSKTTGKKENNDIPATECVSSNEPTTKPTSDMRASYTSTEVCSNPSTSSSAPYASPSHGSDEEDQISKKVGQSNDLRQNAIEKDTDVSDGGVSQIANCIFIPPTYVIDLNQSLPNHIT